MKSIHTISRLNALLRFIVAGTLLSGTAYAAPGEITQTPLFLGGSTPSNVFFLSDDSYSMNFEILTEDYENDGILANAAIDGSATSLGDFIHRHGYVGLKRPGYLEGADCTFKPLDFFNPDGDSYEQILEVETPLGNFCKITAEEEWRGRDYTFNKLYYNPTRKYEPWSGTDINGIPYANMEATNARINPFDPSIGTLDLLNDSALMDRTNGEFGARNYYQSDEWKKWCEAEKIAISKCYGWRYYYYDDSGNRQVKWLHELPVTGSNGEIDTQTNFSNWFTYHRSRDFSAKYALSKVVTQIANARIGFAPINDRKYAIAIEDTTEQHRNSVLESIFSNNPAGSTPLRSSLYEVGQYFEKGTPLSTDSSSGFNGESPILTQAEGGNCQRNATILMTDGFYDETSKDVNFDIGDEDSKAGGDHNTIFDGGLFADGENNVKNTLADIAMYYFERDLSDLPNEVLWTKKEADSIPTGISKTTFMHQHMNTYTIAFGLKGSLNPATTSPDADGFSWPNPEDAKIYRIDDLWHAAYNGRGSFLSAGDSEQLAAALSEALPDGKDIIGSPAKVTFSSFRLDDNSKVFSSRFSPLDWSGEFRARTIIGKETISDAVLWDASNKFPSASNRKIVSFDGKRGISFQWDELSFKQKLALSGGNDAEGKNRIDYLRGDQSKEQATGNGNYRNRATLLGDIVNSGPEYVGKPRFLFPNTALFGATEGNAYYDFWRGNQTRPPVVYVGANDGMLHGFDAETGTELLAYVPEGVYENLSKLTNPDYTHQFFVDASPRQFDALFAPSGNGSSAWHTVLTGGLGAGGKGWYALDVTNPDFSKRKPKEIVLWEFNESDDRQNPSELSDVGYSFSQPLVILTNAEKNGKKRWAIATGNGYNSESGIAKLFIIFLDADPTDGWQKGPLNDYIEISTEHGGPSVSDMNGLSSPFPVDSDGDWVSDHIYAGDVKGHLWAFDISSTNANKWKVSYNNGSTPQPLFTARNASGEIQPITARPTAIRHSQVKRKNSNIPNILIYVGTGQYLTTDDPNNTDTQSFYAIWDRGIGGLIRSDLTEQTLITYETNTTGSNSIPVEARFTDGTVTVPYQNTSKPGSFGWQVDLHHPLASTGERVFTPAYVQHGVVYFTTFQPNASSCGFGGSGWFMTLDALNGGPPPQPVIDLDRNNIVDIGDRVFSPDGTASVTSGTRTTGNGGAASFTNEGVTPSTPDSGLPALTKKWSGPDQQSGRLSWKELRL